MATKKYYDVKESVVPNAKERNPPSLKAIVLLIKILSKDESAGA